jgi:hypothetical protein
MEEESTIKASQSTRSSEKKPAGDKRVDIRYRNYFENNAKNFEVRFWSEKGFSGLKESIEEQCPDLPHSDIVFAFAINIYGGWRYIEDNITNKAFLNRFENSYGIKVIKVENATIYMDEVAYKVQLNGYIDPIEQIKKDVAKQAGIAATDINLYICMNPDVRAEDTTAIMQLIKSGHQLFAKRKSYEIAEEESKESDQ